MVGGCLVARRCCQGRPERYCPVGELLRQKEKTKNIGIIMRKILLSLLLADLSVTEMGDDRSNVKQNTFTCLSVIWFN